LAKNTSSKRLRSFEELKKAFKSKTSIIGLSSPVKKERIKNDRIETKSHAADMVDETALFLRAMEGVTPMFRNTHAGNLCKGHRSDYDNVDPESCPDVNPDIILQMKRLVDEGKGFNVSATPEYHQGAGYNVHPEIMERLHQGDFSIQDYIDLHGCTAAYADERLERFLKHSIRDGKRAVLIIHGRGLSSKDEPVLKKRVIKKLSVGKWRKWVMAYTSAEIYDGGAGATYVLLRKHPVPRRIRKTTPYCSL